MNISKAIPVRFWLNGQETFNQKEVPGIDKRNFYQKFNLADDIVLQLSDTSQKSYILVIKNSNDLQVGEIYATHEEVEGIHYFSWDFSFSDLVLPAGRYSFEIYSEGIVGTGAVTAPIGVISGSGTVGVYVQITGNGNVTGILGAVTADGRNYAFSSEEFLLEATTDDICAASPITLYYQGTWGEGTFVFIDKEFSNFPVGYNYIKKAALGNPSIFQYNDINGQVGADTGVDCP